jgi:hypothetical protein
LNLKTYDFMSLLDGAFSIYRRNFGLFFWISAVFLVLPLLAAQIVEIRFTGVGDIFTRLGEYMGSLSPDSSEGDQAFFDNLRLFLLYTIPINAVLFIVTPLSWGPLINAIHRNALGEGCGFRQAFRIGRKKYLSLVAGFILFNLVVGAVLFPVAFVFGIGIAMMANPACMCGLMGLLMPVLVALIIYISVLFSLFAQSIVVENRSALDGLSRSARLIRGSWWRAFGILIIVQMLVGFIVAFSQFGFETLNEILLYLSRDLEVFGYAAVATGLTVVQVFTNPVLLLAQTILFYDLKVRREAYDVEVMIRGFSSQV